MNVDTLHPNQFFPPKDVQDNPFEWSEWSPYFWLSSVDAAPRLLPVAISSFVCAEQAGDYEGTYREACAPHQRALNAIRRSRRSICQVSEDQKTYYTQLTDTLRQYIQERFGFNALEMTSERSSSRLQATGDRR
jgi:hypothetical protein